MGEIEAHITNLHRECYYPFYVSVFEASVFLLKVDLYFYKTRYICRNQFKVLPPIWENLFRCKRNIEVKCKNLRRPVKHFSSNQQADQSSRPSVALASFLFGESSTFPGEWPDPAPVRNRAADQKDIPGQWAWYDPEHLL